MEEILFGLIYGGYRVMEGILILLILLCLEKKYKKANEMGMTPPEGT